LEIETRKSGDYQGVDMPHYHLLVWLPENIAKDDILENTGQLWRDMWHDITGSQHEWHKARYGCQVENIRSRRHAYFYASKYVAKVSDGKQKKIGRRWGRIGQFDTDAVYEIEITYQQFVELKRLITAYARKRRKHTAKMFSRLNPSFGMTAFGLGIYDAPGFHLQSSLIWRMLFHTIEICNEKSKMRREETA
jgi:hypothetical protein